MLLFRNQTKFVYLFSTDFYTGRESHQLFFDFEQRKKQTNKRPNALFKMIQNMSIRGYYRSILLPTFFLGGCFAGINDYIISGLLKKYHAFQAESGKHS